MMPGLEELGPAFGMMYEADRMPVTRMRVPVQTPTLLDVAVVLPPVNADAREDPHQDPRIEDARVKPVTGAARVQPFPPEQPREQERRDHTAHGNPRAGRARAARQWRRRRTTMRSVGTRGRRLRQPTPTAGCRIGPLAAVSAIRPPRAASRP